MRAFLLAAKTLDQEVGSSPQSARCYGQTFATTETLVLIQTEGG